MFFVVIFTFCDCGFWFLLGNFVFVFVFFPFPDLDLSYEGSADGESISDLGFSKWLESVRGKPGLWALLTCLICCLNAVGFYLYLAL